MLAMLALNSCIENDIPLPYIEGVIEEISVEGLIKADIDAVKKTINLEISDTVDIRELQITKLKITDGARLTDSITHTQIDSGAMCDFTHKRISWVVTTYQEYNWTILPVQTINRHIEVEGQVGAASIDVANKIATVYVIETENLTDIKVKSFQLANSMAVITPEPLSITDFSSPVEFTVTYFDIVEKWTVSFVPKKIEAQTDSAKPWAQFAHMYGTVLPNSPELTGFQYKITGAEQWSTVETNSVGSAVTAIATGLTSNREYEYRTFLGQAYGETLKFNTMTAPTMPNLHFNDGYFDGKTFYPNATGKNSYWGTGNEGLTSYIAGGKPSNTIIVHDDAVKGSAMQLTSVGGIPIVGHAAGNLFTGTFMMGVSINPEVMKTFVKFGRPFTGRPTGLKGWFKYQSSLITEYKYLPEKKGFPDECHIYIKLEDWGDSSLPPGGRPANAKELAYGEMHTSNNITKYTEFTFPLVYDKDYMEFDPTHVIMVVTSSRYGEDFCGGVESVLKVDEFELLYDYNPKAFE